MLVVLAAAAIAGCGSSAAGDAGGADASLSDAAGSDAGTDSAALDAGPPPPGCNGAELLCTRRYDEVVYATTHNAMSNADDGWIAPNQTHGVSRQLADGVRALMLDIYPWKGGVYVCHGSCGLGNRPLVDVLVDVRTLLEDRPRDVVTIIFEAYVGAAETEAAFADAGLLAALHTQDPAQPWPTLDEMGAAGTRLVVFTDSGAGSPGWYHDVWAFAWDTAWQASSPADFSCDPDRGDPSNSLFILNNFLISPIAAPFLAEMVNHNPELLARAEMCRDASGSLPNFVTVDYYEIGDLFEAVATLNGL